MRVVDSMERSVLCLPGPERSLPTAGRHTGTVDQSTVAVPVILCLGRHIRCANCDQCDRCGVCKCEYPDKEA